MNNQEYAKKVIDELTHTLTKIDTEDAEKFVELVDEAKTIVEIQGVKKEDRKTQ